MRVSSEMAKCGLIVAIGAALVAGAVGQGKSKPPATTYTVVYRNAPGDAVKTNVASLTAVRDATGFDVTSSGSNLEINLATNAGITPTPVAPNIACPNAAENEPCLLAAESDKVRSVGSMKLYVMDCASQTELAGLEAIPEGGSGCARIAYFISDLGSLNWAARFNPETPSWAQSRYLAIERGAAGSGTANTWWVETQPESSGPCVEGDCAGVTRNKQPRKAKGVVIEGFFHAPHAFTVTKN